MNDYKELIVKCDYWINLGDEIGKKLAITKFMEECRDAIEQLVKERDAAMSDIPSTCGFCAHEDDEEWCERGCRWEWRGVQEVDT